MEWPTRECGTLPESWPVTRDRFIFVQNMKNKT
jgi:hypothetical protein